MNPPPVGAPTDPQSSALAAKENDKRIKAVAATGVIALAALRLQHPAIADPIIHKLTGIDLRKPGAAKVTPLAWLWLLPQPVGLAPPSWYGLPPNYLAKIAPFLPESELLHTVGPDHPSVQEHARKQQQRQALQVTKFDNSGLIMSETVEVVKGLDIGGKATFIKRNAQDLANWFANQLTGPHIGSALEHSAFVQAIQAAVASNPPAEPEQEKYIAVVVALQSLVMQALQAANGFDP